MYHVLSKHRRPFLILASIFFGLLCGYGVTVYKQARVWDLYQENRLTISSFYFERGNYYFGGGAYDLERALSYYDAAMGWNPSGSDPIHYQRGRVYFIKGDFKQALFEFNKQLELNPSFKRTYYMRGLTYGYQGSLKEAADDFKIFLEWIPYSWAGHNDLVWIYFRMGDFEQAEKYARQGLTYAPGNPWLSNALGAILLNKGLYAEAREHLLVAQSGFSSMTEQQWGEAYPGNDPRVYTEGRQASLSSVEQNLLLVSQKHDSE